MKLIIVWACAILPVLAISDEGQVRKTLLGFITKLSSSNPHPISGWNSSSYPCQDWWEGVTCDNQDHSVKRIVLSGFNFSGVLDAHLLCTAPSLSTSLSVLDVSRNSIQCKNLEDIAYCSRLTHLLIGRNQFSGVIPPSFSNLRNLKVLDVSHNQFSGSLLDAFPKSLTTFLAQDNQFSGTIPNLDFTQLLKFNISYNDLSGPIPARAHRFNQSSFIHNPHLCGPPLSENCASVFTVRISEPGPVPQPKPEHGHSADQIMMFSGYGLLGLAVVLLVLLCLYKQVGVKSRVQKSDLDSKVASVDETTTKHSFSSVELKACHVSNSHSDPASASLTVVTSPVVNGLRFEDLLRAPAVLLGRGKHGSVYKVSCQGIAFAVKRIKDWPILSNEFKQRMMKLSQVKHPNLLPVMAFYTSREEKLLVYEFQDGGSLFGLIHGNQARQPFDWSSRISTASTIASTLAFLHKELHHDKIPHGNLKSSNILMNAKMEARISEYGLMSVQDDRKSPFKADTFAFGVILLELLTGRTVENNNGLDLASWVLAVVREEWTGEVFDKNLVREGANEERMLNMLQVAIRCTNKSPEARPDMKEVASIIGTIRDEDDRSMDVSDLSVSKSFVEL